MAARSTLVQIRSRQRRRTAPQRTPEHVFDKDELSHDISLYCPQEVHVAETKNLLLRLDPALAERLHAVAEVEGRTVSDVVREAIAGHVERRQDDPAFARLVRASIDRHSRLLASLAEDEV